MNEGNTLIIRYKYPLTGKLIKLHVLLNYLNFTTGFDFVCCLNMFMNNINIQLTFSTNQFYEKLY
jgi:hypothetical protein